MRKILLGSEKKFLRHHVAAEPLRAAEAGLKIFDTSWRYSKAKETCQRLALSPGSLAIKNFRQRAKMPNLSERQAEAAAKVTALLRP